MESFRQFKTQFQEIKYIYFHTDYVPKLSKFIEQIFFLLYFINLRTIMYTLIKGQFKKIAQSCTKL